MTDRTGEAELLRRYALALALIPDRDEADDIFRLSRSEADLWRRAEVWLSRRGQGVPLAEPRLPTLDLDQQEHALHLAQLGRKRRVLVPLAAAVAVVLLIVGLVVVNRWDRSRLTAANVYGDKPVVEGTQDGYRFALYKAEENADEGTITVWWSVASPNLDPTVAETIHPSLLVRGSRLGGGWVPPTLTVVERPQFGKYLGRSIYPTPMPRGTDVGIQFSTIGTQSVEWTGDLPLGRKGSYSHERTVTVEQSLADGGQAVRIHSVTLAPSYALVRYGTNRATLNPNLWLQPTGPNSLVKSWGIRDISSGEVEEIFPPVVDSTSNLKIMLASAVSTLRTSVLLNLTDADASGALTVTRDGQQVEVSVKIAPGFADQLGALTDAQLIAGGKEYPGIVSWSSNGQVAQMKVSASLPEWERPTQLRVISPALPQPKTGAVVTVLLP